MNYRNRMTIIFIIDSLIVSFAIFLAHWIVYPSITKPFDAKIIVITAVSLLIFHHLFAVHYKLYNKVWSYASVGELNAIIKAVTLSVIAALIIQLLINDFSVYRRAFLVTWMLHIIFIGGSRFAWRIYRDRYITNNDERKKPTLIVGAGDAGAMIARQLNNDHNDSGLMPIAF